MNAKAKLSHSKHDTVHKYACCYINNIAYLLKESCCLELKTKTNTTVADVL